MKNNDRDVWVLLVLGIALMTLCLIGILYLAGFFAGWGLRW